MGARRFVGAALAGSRPSRWPNNLEKRNSCVFGLEGCLRHLRAEKIKVSSTGWAALDAEVHNP
jgi:hypothetical protein